MSLRIGMVYDARSDYLSQGYAPEDVAEFDSDETIASLEGTIRSLGYEVVRVGNARALAARLATGERWDLVFNIAEGMGGRSREAQVPCLLDIYGIRYTFSDPLVCAVCLDKAVTKKLVAAAGLNTPACAVVRSMDDVRSVNLRYPLFVKPIAEGTGKGISDRSIVERPEDLRSACADIIRRCHEPALVEEYLPGREFTVGVLGTGAAAQAIGTMEMRILPDAGTRVYSFATKENCESLCEYSRLAEQPLKQRVEELALNAHVTLECRDASRVDIRLDGNGAPSFMEINPLPGLHPTHSDLPMIATREGISYAELLNRVIRSALSRDAA